MNTKEFKTIRKSLLVLGFALTSVISAKSQSSELQFLPATAEVGVGDTITTFLTMDAGNAPISAFDINLEFENQFLEVISVENVPVDLYTYILPPSYTNVDGKITASAFQIGKTLPQQSFALLKVKMIALAATDHTEVKHNLTGNHRTILAYGGVDMLGQAGSFDVTIFSLDDISTGVENPTEVFGMAVWPNPASDIVKVRFQLKNESQLDLGIYDLNGKLLESIFEGDAIPGQEYQLEVDMKKYAAGNYFFRLSSDETSETKILTKTK